MSDTATARQLARYNQWANRVLVDAVAALPPEEWTKERPTLFKTMVGTLNHIHVVNIIWRAHLEGREHGIPALNTLLHADLATLAREQDAIDAWYVQWADAQSEASLAQAIDFALIGGNRSTMTRHEVLLHVTTHCSYHRGWVADLFFQVPGKRPPTMDLPVYKRLRAAS